MPEIFRFDVPRCRLGEGPLWDEHTARLYYADVFGHRLCRLDPETGAHEDWDIGTKVSALALTGDGRAVLATGRGFELMDLETGARSPIADPENGHPETQYNDAKADARGRFLCGTVHMAASVPMGRLYCVERGAVRVLEEGILISNGPCWSPDGTTFYHADSARKQIYAYDYDLERGALSRRRPFFTTADHGGIPDGATVDAEGNLWVAVCEAGTILCISPEGTLLQTVELPTRWVSSVMFGGAGLDRLFVTSIDPTSFGRPPEPAGGGLYVVDGLGAHGLREHRYAV